MSRLPKIQLALLTIAAVFALHASPVLAEAQKIGVVGAVSGTVSVKSMDGTSRNLNAGDEVFLNDTINSSAGSKAQIMFLDKSSLMINPDSTVMVDKFVFNPATSTGDLSIQNAKGALRFIGGALSKEKPVTIKTPVATIGIRGGIADTHVGANGATDAIFVYGDEMTMTNGNGQTASVTTPGQGLGLATATSMPVQLPPERVMQRLQGFSSGDAPAVDDAAGADNAEDGSNTNQRQENGENSANNEGDGESNASDGQEGNGASGDDGAGSQEGNGASGDSGTGSQEGNGASGDNGAGSQEGNGASGNSNENSQRSGNNTSADANSNGQGRKGDRGPNNRGPNGGPNNGGPNGAAQNHTKNNNGYAGGPPPAFKPAGIGNPHPGTSALLNIVQNTNLLTSTNQQSVQNNNTTQFTQPATNPNLFGKFVRGENGAYNSLNSGSTSFQNIGTRVNGTLNGTGGNTSNVSLPWLTNTGFHGSSAGDFIIVDSSAYTGNAFISPERSMQYFRLNEVGGNKNIGLVFGNVAQQSNWSSNAATSAVLASNRLSFYDFLPDLHQYGSSDFGFFDYNIANQNLAPGVSPSQIGNLGMAIDWSGQRYLTGHFIWEKSSPTALERELTLSFGRTMTNGRLLDGRLYELRTEAYGGDYETGIESGYLRVLDAYSAGAASPFDGFIADGIIPGNTNLDSTQAFSDTNGYVINQPLVANNNTTDPTGGSRTAQSMQGFAAGYIVTDIGPSGSPYTTRTFNRYGNDEASGVQITTSASSNNVTAEFSLEDIDDPDLNPNYIQANFGNSGGQTADSAFLGDELYAAQQGKMKYVDPGISAYEYAGSDVNSGALVAATYISDTAASCNACEFVHWGVWAGEIDRSDSSYNITDSIPLMPYVAGQITQNLTSINTSVPIGKLNYTGVMYGQVLQSNNLTRSTGSFTAGIDLRNRKLVDYSGQFAGMNFGFTGANHTISGSGAATFNDVAVAGTGVTGHINGALFGSLAQDVAGNFSLQSATKEAAGVYLGTRQ